MDKRPFVNYYERDAEGIEQLISRRLNDEEWAEYQERMEVALNAPEPEHPVIKAVRSMSDEEKAVLRELLS